MRAKTYRQRLGSNSLPAVMKLFNDSQQIIDQWPRNTYVLVVARAGDLTWHDALMHGHAKGGA